MSSNLENYQVRFQNLPVAGDLFVKVIPVTPAEVPY